MAALMLFWKKNTETAKAPYLKRLLQPPAADEGMSRAQTREIRVTFTDAETRLRFTMNNGAETTLKGAPVNNSNVKSIARDLCLMAYGNDRETQSLATMLQLRQPGKELVMLRGGKFEME